MVLQRRLAYGFSGYEVPVVPRASRSARGRVPIREKREDNPVHAFEILASVAGELLQETESSSPYVACGVDQNNIAEWKKEPPEQETFEENTFPYVPALQGNASGSYFATVAADFPHSGEIFGGHVISAIETKSKAELPINQSRQPEKICFATKWPYFNGRDASRGPFGEVCGAFPRSGELVKGCLYTKELCSKPPALISSESNLRASLFRGYKTLGLFSKYCADIEVGSRDDDETSVGCSPPSTIVTAYKPSPNIAHRRIRNLSESRLWRAAPNMNDWKWRPVNSNGRSCYTHQRSKRISPYKRRKWFTQIPLSTSEGGFHCNDIFNSPDKGSISDGCRAARESPSSVAAQQEPPEPKSRDCNVKLSIKSLKVPELLIEIPATATVGSLKRTVMEAVTAVLGNGLRVGVLLRGKTIRDDRKTLLQAGISNGDKRHRLGFVLEPNHAQLTTPPCTEDCSLLSGGSCQGLTGHMLSLSVQPVHSDVTPLPQMMMNTGGSVDSNSNAAVQTINDIFVDNTMPDSQALVAIPAVSMDAMAVVPFHRKAKHHELVQRRTRRPFSVVEVEALVQAVEKLGTGRWRDIKLSAFDSANYGANYRTYVDLKDKWKTLVHTARISPQQRRGEPVPQQLLDRVLAAQAFWSLQRRQ